MHARRVAEGVHQEGLDAEKVVGEAPRTVGLAPDRDLVAELLAQHADGVENRGDGQTSEKVVGHVNLVRVIPDAPQDGGEIVRISPVHLAPHGSGLVGACAEYREHVVVAAHPVPGEGQLGHDFGVVMRIGEIGADLVLELAGHDGVRVGDRRDVDFVAVERIEHSLPARKRHFRLPSLSLPHRRHGPCRGTPGNAADDTGMSVMIEESAGERADGGRSDVCGTWHLVVSVAGRTVRRAPPFSRFR